MISLINESTVTLLECWKRRIETEGGTADIKIDHHMRSFSADVISRACFGSNFSRGKDIFHKLRQLQELMAKNYLRTGIPGMRYIPTKSNRVAWALEKDVRSLILQAVKERKEAPGQKDLLQMILEGAKDSDLSPHATDSFIVDNCKNIYLAAYETTAVSATWCLMLLASNPEWQARVRTEVLQNCGNRFPDADMLRKMKQVLLLPSQIPKDGSMLSGVRTYISPVHTFILQLTMVIQESLRLYPPVAVISREALKDMKLGDIQVPRGVNVWIMVVTLHTDPENWGPDAYKFNPERFANGIAGACKLPHLYMPFGVGPRVCLGQNLAMVELKILISLVLQNFTFCLSTKYTHSPALRLVIEPEHGVDLQMRKLEAVPF